MNSFFHRKLYTTLPTRKSLLMIGGGWLYVVWRKMRALVKIDWSTLHSLSIEPWRYQRNWYSPDDKSRQIPRPRITTCRWLTTCDYYWFIPLNGPCSVCLCESICRKKTVKRFSRQTFHCLGWVHKLPFHGFFAQPTPGSTQTSTESCSTGCSNCNSNTFCALKVQYATSSARCVGRPNHPKIWTE